MNGTSSEALSGIFVDAAKTFPVLKTLGYTSLQMIVRKAAHMTEYAALGASSVWSLNWTERDKAEKCAFLFSAMMAGIDEIHQLLVSGRSGNIVDVMVDCLGAYIGICLYSLLRKKSPTHP